MLQGMCFEISQTQSLQFLTRYGLSKHGLSKHGLSRGTERLTPEATDPTAPVSRTHILPLPAYLEPLLRSLYLRREAQSAGKSTL